jgi:hypothetical protein
MPKLYNIEVDVDIDPVEFIESCSNRDITKIIKYLVKNKYISDESYMNVKLTDMEDKLKKHLDFCKKYPQTIVGYEQGINVSYYLMEGKDTPQVDYFKVGDLVKMYNENPNVFSEYRNLKEDWNNLIKTEDS